MLAKVKWGWRWFWHLVLRNRFAIFIASLFWLLYRSGTQPRRLAYPCQQVAAVNVGAFLAALIPTSLLLRRHKGGVALPKAVVVRRQLIAAALICLVGVIGIETYQYADSLLQPAAVLPSVPPPPVPPPPALVSIAHKPYPSWRPLSQVPARPPFTDQEIDGLVERAVTLAGGIDDLLVDKNTNGEVLVVLKPNLVNDIDVTVYPENGVVTDHRIMKSVVRLVKEAATRKGIGNLRVVIADGTAGPWDWYNGYKGRDITKYAFIKTGYTTNPVTGRQWFTHDGTVELIDLNDSGGLDVFDPAKVTQVTINDAVMRRTYWVPKILVESDVLISVPTLKNHSNADVTAALKNRVGCAPSDIYHNLDSYENHGHQMKRALHFDNMGFPWDIDRNSGLDYPAQTSDENLIVNYTIVDLNLLRPQDFAVIDGLIGIKDGPVGNTKASPNMQLVMAGRDSVAVDTVATLLMGYDPQYVRHLRWAYNRELGTMSVGDITVVGDHVALWRQYFGDYGPNDSPCDLTPPTLYGITPVVEGATVVDSDKITVTSFADTVGPVVRAEAALALLGENLLANGDFEQGETGWTKWWAPWGTAGNSGWNFTDPNVPPGGGQNCLRLGNASTNCSFGVYQQVTVEPGKTYRLDCQWKGRRLGEMNWFEVLLLDGPWSIVQADSGDPITVVEPNYMYAYDNNTYPFQGAIGTAFGWIWTHRQYAPPAREVDWNNRLGRRKASGNVMTVVLKAGTTGTGVEAYFDNVILSEVSEDYVVAAVADPTPGAELNVDLGALPPGTYSGELRVTVYDASLNEDSLYHNVTVQTCPQDPWVCTNREFISHAVFVSDTAPSDTVEIWNCTCLGGDLNYTISTNVPWIHVEPPDGTSIQDPPTTNVHTIWYDHLPPNPAPGHTPYVGEITITGSHNVKKITVTIDVQSVAPDLDYDGDVDQTDFGMLQACYTGVTQVSGPCAAMDFNTDSFVNSADFAVLKGCISGSGEYPQQGCD